MVVIEGGWSLMRNWMKLVLGLNVCLALDTLCRGDICKVSGFELESFFFYIPSV
jgi:hypothetical protein